MLIHPGDLLLPDFRSAKIHVPLELKPSAAHVGVQDDLYSAFLRFFFGDGSSSSSNAGSGGHSEVKTEELFVPDSHADVPEHTVVLPVPSAAMDRGTVNNPANHPHHHAHHHGVASSSSSLVPGTTAESADTKEDKDRETGNTVVPSSSSPETHFLNIDGGVDNNNAVDSVITATAPTPDDDDHVNHMCPGLNHMDPDSKSDGSGSGRTSGLPAKVSGGTTATTSTIEGKEANNNRDDNNNDDGHGNVESDDESVEHQNNARSPADRATTSNINADNDADRATASNINGDIDSDRADDCATTCNNNGDNDADRAKASNNNGDNDANIIQTSSSTAVMEVVEDDADLQSTALDVQGTVVMPNNAAPPPEDGDVEMSGVDHDGRSGTMRRPPAVVQPNDAVHSHDHASVTSNGTPEQGADQDAATAGSPTALSRESPEGHTTDGVDAETAIDARDVDGDVTLDAARLSTLVPGSSSSTVPPSDQEEDSGIAHPPSTRSPIGSDGGTSCVREKEEVHIVSVKNGDKVGLAPRPEIMGTPADTTTSTNVDLTTAAVWMTSSEDRDVLVCPTTTTTTTTSSANGGGCTLGLCGEGKDDNATTHASSRSSGCRRVAKDCNNIHLERKVEHGNPYVISMRRNGMQEGGGTKAAAAARKRDSFSIYDDSDGSVMVVSTGVGDYDSDDMEGSGNGVIKDTSQAADEEENIRVPILGSVIGDEDTSTAEGGGKQSPHTKNRDPGGIEGQMQDIDDAITTIAKEEVEAEGPHHDDNIRVPDDDHTAQEKASTPSSVQPDNIRVPDGIEMEHEDTTRPTIPHGVSNGSSEEIVASTKTTAMVTTTGTNYII